MIMDAVVSEHNNSVPATEERQTTQIQIQVVSDVWILLDLVAFKDEIDLFPKANEIFNQCFL